MDYTTQPLRFKIKKALCYVRLYGLRRTWLKIRAQYHMKKRFAALPAPSRRRNRHAHVGIIGCGNFGFSTIAYYLTRNYGHVIRAAMDIDVHRAASLGRRFGACYYTDDAEELLCDPAIDLVFIASNHASHAEYAIRALEEGKSVHIEKPHVVTEDQLTRLCSAMANAPGAVALGFNRPGSRLGRAIKRYLDAESGPAMYNWFVAGHELPPDHWYFKPEEGGRVLGNLCHWTDFLYQMVAPEDRYPIRIVPARSHQSECDIAVSYVFRDGSIGAITFSAKGQVLEGVTERLSAQRGNALVFMQDFKSMVVKVFDRTYSMSTFHRDHGHQDTIRRSYQMVRPAGTKPGGASIRYVWETGQLFLKTKQALEQNQELTIDGYHDILSHHAIPLCSR
jgi:predicted dehydrogenase